MGMASYYEDGCVPLEDVGGFQEYVEAVKAGKVKVKGSTVTAWVEALKIEKNADGSYRLSFEGFDQWKIISYWYPEFVTVLRDIAAFVGDGYVNFSFEGQDEAATIKFDGRGGVVIEIGEMKYTKYKLTDLRKEIPEPIDLVKKRLLSRAI